MRLGIHWYIVWCSLIVLRYETEKSQSIIVSVLVSHVFCYAKAYTSWMIESQISLFPIQGAHIYEIWNIYLAWWVF